MSKGQPQRERSAHGAQGRRPVGRHPVGPDATIAADLDGVVTGPPGRREVRWGRPPHRRARPPWGWNRPGDRARAPVATAGPPRWVNTRQRRHAVRAASADSSARGAHRWSMSQGWACTKPWCSSPVAPRASLSRARPTRARKKRDVGRAQRSDRADFHAGRGADMSPPSCTRGRRPPTQVFDAPHHGGSLPICGRTAGKLL